MGRLFTRVLMIFSVVVALLAGMTGGALAAPPRIPTSLGFVNDTSLTAGQTRLTWSNNSNPVGTQYELWRKILRPDGSVEADQLIYSGPDRTFITDDQSLGRYYTYRVRSTNGEYSAFTAEVDFWSPPVPTVQQQDSDLLLSWDSVQDDYIIDPGDAWAITVNPRQTTSRRADVPNGLYASKAQITWSGFDGGVDYYLRYWDGTDYYDDTDQTWYNNYYNVPSTYTLLPGASGSTWVTIPRTARDIRLYVRDKGSTSAGQISITGLEIVSPVRYRVQYSVNGTTWSTFSSNLSGTSLTIPNTSLSPANRYQFALYPPSLPNGGTFFRAVNPNWYSPLYPAVAAVAVANETPTGGRIYWSRGSISTSTPITVYRDGVQVYRGAPSYASTTIGGVSGSWGYFTDSGLVTGQTYSYSICAENALGDCNPVTLTYMPTVSPPTSLALSATAPANNQVTLSWNPNGNEPGTTYEVWRSTLSSNGTVSRDERIYTGTATSFNTIDQQPGRYYRYRARTIGSNSISPFTGEVDYWTPPIPTVTQVGTSLVVSWSDVQAGNAARYNVYYSANGTTWSTAQSGVTGTEITIAYPGAITPANRYQIAIQQYSLPNGGPTFRNSDGAWYSPLWPAPLRTGADGISTNGATIWWARGRSSSGIAAAATVRVFRDDSLVWEGVPSYTYSNRFGATEDWASFTAPPGSLVPDSTYQYSVCAVNALGECGPVATQTVLTLPSTAATLDYQQGSYGWSKTAAGGAWAELTWSPVPSATSYKVYVNGSASTVGNVTRHRLTLDSGTAYTIRVAAVNTTGEGGAAQVSFTTPARADSVAPSNGELVINEGASVVSGGRVRARVSATDSLSGVMGVQLSNDGKIWSPLSVIRDWSYDNLINAAGGNAYFTDLGGWESESSIWSTIKGDPSARGGAYVNIRWEEGAGRWSGLKLADLMPAVPGEPYTVKIRYRVNGLTQGSVGIWSHFVGESGSSVGASSHTLQNSSTWTEATFTATAQPGSIGRWIKLGFDQANPGASLDVDYIHISEGRQVFQVRNQLSSTPVFTMDWEIPTRDFAPKTISARFVDLAGNVSSTVTATVQFMLTDTTSPQVVVKINGGSPITSQRTVTLQISAVDDQTPQGSLRMRIGNSVGVFSEWERFSPTKMWQLCDESDGYCEGERTVWVEVQDSAGNTGSGFAKIFFRLDSAPISGEAFTTVEGNPGMFRLGSTLVRVTYARASEVTLKWNVGANDLVRYGLDPAVYGRWETFTEERKFVLPGQQGIQTVYAQLEDGRIFVQRFVLDTSAPTFAANWIGGATITQPGGKTTLVLAAQDNLSAPEDLKVSINGGPWLDFKSEIPVTLTGTGLKSVTVRVMDPAGNESSQTLSIFTN